MFVGISLTEVLLTVLVSFSIQEMKTKPTITGRDIIKTSNINLSLVYLVKDYFLLH